MNFVAEHPLEAITIAFLLGAWAQRIYLLRGRSP